MYRVVFPILPVYRNPLNRWLEATTLQGVRGTAFQAPERRGAFYPAASPSSMQPVTHRLFEAVVPSRHNLRKLNQYNKRNPATMARFLLLAEGEGFKPPIPIKSIPDFESGAFDHSANFPYVMQN